MIYDTISLLSWWGTKILYVNFILCGKNQLLFNVNKLRWQLKYSMKYNKRCLLGLKLKYCRKLIFICNWFFLIYAVRYITQIKLPTNFSFLQYLIYHVTGHIPRRCKFLHQKVDRRCFGGVWNNCKLFTDYKYCGLLARQDWWKITLLIAYVTWCQWKLAFFWTRWRILCVLLLFNF